MSERQDASGHQRADQQQAAEYGAYQQYDQQNQSGYDYSAYYQDPSAYGQQAYDASSYSQQSYGSGGGYGSRDTAGDGGRGHRQDRGSGGHRDREGGRDNDRYGDSRGSYSRRDNYQDQSSRNDEGSEPGMENSPDTIYITNLPDTVTEEKLAEVFGSIGIIKMDRKTEKPKIWIYTDKATGKPKGDATITYDDPPTSDAAIDWFGNKDFMGNIIKVDKAQRKAWTGGRGGGSAGRGGGRGGGYSGGGGGGFRGDSSGGASGRGPPPPRDGDWACESCGINNFARQRTECFKCKAPRPASTMQSSGGGGDRGGYRGRRDYGDDKYSRGDGDRGSSYGSRGGSDRRDRDDLGRHSGGGRDNDYRGNERRERRDRPY